MDGVELAARLILSATFAVSALAKWFDARGTRQSLHDFGLWRWLIATAVVALPAVELIAAAMLLPIKTAKLGAAIAFVLLVIFTWMIRVGLRKDRNIYCHCFGSISSRRPVGVHTLIRNGVLASMALFIILAAGTDQPPSFLMLWGHLDTLEVILTAISILCLAATSTFGWLLWQLWQQQTRLLSRLDKLVGINPPTLDMVNQPSAPTTVILPVGSPAPPFGALDALHQEQSLTALLKTGKPLVLIFVHSACGACIQLLPDIARFQIHLGDVTIALVGDRNLTGRTENLLLLDDTNGNIANSYGVVGTPSAVVVTKDGIIRTSLVLGAQEVRRLLISREYASAAGILEEPQFKHTIRADLSRQGDFAVSDGVESGTREKNQHQLATRLGTATALVAVTSASCTSEPNAGATWTGTVTLNDEHLPFRTPLTEREGSVTGSMQFGDPTTGEWVDAGTVNGTRRMNNVTWETAFDHVFSGDLAEGRLSGTLTFPPEDSTSPIVAQVDLSRDSGD